MEESEYTFSDDGESEHEVFLKLEELKYDLDNPAPIKLSPMKRMIDVINLMRTSDVTKDVLVHIS